MIEDVYPGEPLPDLFAGSQLVIVGRYRDSAEGVSIRLSGEVSGERQSFSYEGLDFPANAGGGSGTDAEVFIPRLWATRRIGALLDEIRLRGRTTSWSTAWCASACATGSLPRIRPSLFRKRTFHPDRCDLLRVKRRRAEHGLRAVAGAGADDAAQAIGGGRDAEARRPCRPRSCWAGMRAARRWRSTRRSDPPGADKTFVFRDGRGSIPSTRRTP